jgi:hypothetical protein
LKASLAGNPWIAAQVKTPIRETGARGVPNGFVEAKRCGHGSRPCLAISRIIRAYDSGIIGNIVHPRNRDLPDQLSSLHCQIERKDRIDMLGILPRSAHVIIGVSQLLVIR